MFGRRSSTEAASASDTQAQRDLDEAAARKGRATPSRKEAEAARKAMLKSGSNPKALARDQRAKRAEGVAKGDPKYLPRRDQGPSRAVARDVVDGRRTVSELFMPVTILLFILVLTHNQKLESFVILIWLVMFVGICVDLVVLYVQIRRRIRREVPESTDGGAGFYGMMRALQLRRLRLPKPRVGPGSARNKAKTPRAK